jgi:ATP-dependent RNA helicase HrpA
VRAREVFIRDALVPGAIATKGPFLAHNRKLVAEVAELEHKARRQDVLVDDEAIAAFYQDRIPSGVHSLASFERWREGAERADPRVLYLTRDALMRHAALNVTETLFPEKITLAGNELPLRYRFAPGEPNDGLTLTVPLGLLNQIDAGRLSWLVPGMIREKVTLLLKSLPKQLRNRLHPLPDAVTSFLDSALYADGALTDALSRWLRTRLGKPVPPDVWDNAEIPAYLEVAIRVVDASGRELAWGRDPARLRAELGEAAKLSLAGTKPALERRGLKVWDFGALPETLATARNGQRITGYPALVDDGDSVSIVLFDTRPTADTAMRAAVIRLIRIALKDHVARYEKGGTGFAQAALQLKTTIPSAQLLADVLTASCDRAFVGDDPLPRSESAFAEQVKRARTRLPAVAEGAFRLLALIAARHQQLTQRIASLPASAARLAAEIRGRRDALVYPGFFAATPWTQLGEVPRYLAALDRRLVKFAENPGRDARHAATVSEWWERYRERVERNRKAGRVEPGLEQFRWLLEELQVSLFAQELKTPLPVSYRRLEKAWADLSRR